MKEATGELNMTVVTVVAIVAVGAFFYAFIWPAIRNNLLAQTYCSSAIDCKCNDTRTKCECKYYKDTEGKQLGDITCDLSSTGDRANGTNSNSQQ